MSNAKQHMTLATIFDSAEGARLKLSAARMGRWNRWGPFLAERAWGTVREDYSPDGSAWDYFPHEQAHARAYRWNEDGLGGICDRHQYLCFALSLWNGKDPILKERAFGLTGTEGNHGEDVKEYYSYLDSTPTHSYMRFVYKYPHAEFPYERLRTENKARGREQPEYELADTGIFDAGRYFDVGIEYAKAGAEDILIRITVTNHGSESAPIHVLPTIWFRNSWSWGWDERRPTLEKSGDRSIAASHWELGDYVLHGENSDTLLFTDNETNFDCLFGVKSGHAFCKDAFHDYVIRNNKAAVNPANRGTKAAAHYFRDIAPGKQLVIRLRLSARSALATGDPFASFDQAFAQRKAEADEFYKCVLPATLDEDSRLIARQAFGGMLWSKQYYHYVVQDWLQGDPAQPVPPEQRKSGRNRDWTHLFARDVISMPDKWEFPWFASWDLGFHCIALAHVDPQFAKEQILLMLREWYMHPSGQIPAYEWDFNSVNPPILALAARGVFEIDRERSGKADYGFIERVFQKLLLNFTWWVNRKDAKGNNIFHGGFLGMDNISAFDRDRLPPGYMLGQADGTSWMAAFAKSMLSTALLLAERNSAYEDLASKFWEHYIYIANAMNSITSPQDSLWDADDGFFYDHLTHPDGHREPVRARTMVGFVPLFGATAVDASTFNRFPGFHRRRQWFIDHRPDLIHSVQPMVTPGPTGKLILGMVREDQLRRMLARMFDEKEFLSPFGIRAVSKYHEAHPLVLHLNGDTYRLDYEPGESRTDLFGGNSNWRGPIWMPVNFLILMALKEFYAYYGDAFRVEFPTGSGNLVNLSQAADEIARRLCAIFKRDGQGERAVFGKSDLFNKSSDWRDLIPFHEYFHGDTGRGCGASHQTGWTGLIAQLLIGLPTSPRSAMDPG
ncbi:MAG: glucosidase [Phycisphaeraceae bacterium]|nr:glucosidase [Phycisphaeraceae bacterium]